MRKKKSRAKSSPDSTPLSDGLANSATAKSHSRTVIVRGIQVVGGLLVIGSLAFFWQDRQTSTGRGEMIMLQSRSTTLKSSQPDEVAEPQAPPVSVVPIRSAMQNRSIEEQMKHADAEHGAWTSETLSSQATTQLSVLKQVFSPGADSSSADLQSVLSADFSCGSLQPHSWRDVYSAEDGTIQVRRENMAEASILGDVVHHGVAGLQTAFDTRVNVVHSVF